MINQENIIVVDEFFEFIEVIIIREENIIRGVTRVII